MKAGTLMPPDVFRFQGQLQRSRRLKPWLLGFMGLMGAHWIEHVVQMWQIKGMCIPRSKAYGLVGGWFPYLITGEWLHFGFALFTLVGLVALRKAFSGLGHIFWNIAIGIAIWHLGEHTLLFGQSQNWFTFFGHGHDNPTSVLQLAFPGMRAEVHLAYNSLVTVPIILAVWFQRHFFKSNLSI